MFRNCAQNYIHRSNKRLLTIIRNGPPHLIRFIHNDQSQNAWFKRNRFKIGLVSGAISLFPLYYLYEKNKSILFNEPDVSSSSVYVNPSGLPAFVPYILIGGGTASYYAALTIRARDATAKILIIGDEEETPYNRPALSKELWWYGKEDSAKTLEYFSPSGKKRDVHYEVDGFYIAPEKLDAYQHGAVSFIRGKKVVQIDTKKKEIILNTNERIRFEKCLIATGGEPKPMHSFDAPELKNFYTTYRKIDDYQKLDSIARQANSIAVIGGGFLASELAYSLRKRYGKNGLSVHQIIQESGNFFDVLPEFLIEHVKNEMESRGIQIHSNSKIKSAKLLPDNKVELILSDIYSTKLIVDHIVVDSIVEPNVEIASSSGIKLDKKRGGILADYGMCVQPDIYAAGDVCSFDDIILGRRRLEQWEHAQISGRVAGENMTGGSKKYTHQSSFYTMLGSNVYFTGVGDVNSSYEMASEDPEALFRGVVFYLKEKRVVGVILYNIFGMGVEVARKIISDGKEHENIKQLAKLFDIYYTPIDEDSKSDEINNEKTVSSSFEHNKKE